MMLQLCTLAFSILLLSLSIVWMRRRKLDIPRRVFRLICGRRSRWTTSCRSRAAVRQTGGRTPLGLVEKGMGALVVTETGADPMVMQAIKRAYEERGVKIYIVSEHELLNVNKDEALKALKALRWYTWSRATWKCAAGLTIYSSRPTRGESGCKERGRTCTTGSIRSRKCRRSSANSPNSSNRPMSPNA